MTTLAREHRALPPELAQEYYSRVKSPFSVVSSDWNMTNREFWRCQYHGFAGDAAARRRAGTLEQHLQRVIGHLNTMHTFRRWHGVSDRITGFG